MINARVWCVRNIIKVSDPETKSESRNYLDDKRKSLVCQKYNKSK